jgi:hypothetical protein
MADNYGAQAGGSLPIARAIPVVTSNDVDIAHPGGREATRALYIGGAGTVIVKLLEYPSDSITLTGLNAGSILPVRATRVLLTGTTATSIVALY